MSIKSSHYTPEAYTVYYIDYIPGKLRKIKLQQLKKRNASFYNLVLYL